MSVAPMRAMTRPAMATAVMMLIVVIVIVMVMVIVMIMGDKAGGEAYGFHDGHSLSAMGSITRSRRKSCIQTGRLPKPCRKSATMAAPWAGSARIRRKRRRIA